MKFDNQLRYAILVLNAYKGEVPLHAWLKSFFREHRQMGSRDRKLVSNLVYGYYRLGHALKDIPVEERILAGLFLCAGSPTEFLQYFKPQWNEHASLGIEDKIAICVQSGIPFNPAEIFPWAEELSPGIDHYAYCLSFLRQPDLFLRIRPGYKDEVMEKLRSGEHPGHPAAMPFEFLPPATLRLPNGFKVEEIFTPDKEIVIQDYSSQRLASLLEAPLSGAPDVWDACAASGGKSLLAYDLNPRIDLTVSDIRESILHNLRERFRQAGITKYHSFIADLTAVADLHSQRPGKNPGQRQKGFDLILADVPCTGSGTWSRTPEELYFFHPGKIKSYSERQQRIVSNLVSSLGKGAWFLYSTCSVFRKENEEVAAFIKGLIPGEGEPDRMESIKGYDQRADTLFAARFMT